MITFKSVRCDFKTFECLRQSCPSKTNVRDLERWMRLINPTPNPSNDETKPADRIACATKPNACTTLTTRFFFSVPTFFVDMEPRRVKPVRVVVRIKTGNRNASRRRDASRV